MIQRSLTVELQPFSSHPNRLSVLQSESAWDKGPCVYLNEKVPFSFENGVYLARYFSKLFRTLFRPYIATGRVFHVYFVEAGMGILASHILSDLLAFSPDLYPHVCFHLMDTRPSMVRSWGQFDLLQVHRSRLVVEPCFSWETLSFSESADFVLCVDAFSRIPSRQIQIVAGKPYDTVWRTLVPRDAVAWDTSCLPPKRWSISEHLGTDYEAHLSEMLFVQSAFSDFLIHEWGKLRFIPENGMGPAECTDMQAILDAFSFENSNFNYSSLASIAVARMANSLSDIGTLFIQDFGFSHFSDLIELKDLVLEFGVVSLSMVFFPLFQMWLETLRIGRLYKSSTNSAYHILAVTKSDIPLDGLDDLASRFDGFRSTVDELSQIVDGEVFLRQLYHALPGFDDTELCDYGFNMRVALDLMERGLIDDAIPYLMSNLKHYGTYSVSALTVLARIMRVRRRFDLAESYLNSAFAVAPFYIPTLYELAQLYLVQKKYDHAVDIVSQTITLSGNKFPMYRPLIEQLLSHSFLSSNRSVLVSSLRLLEVIAR